MNILKKIAKIASMKRQKSKKKEEDKINDQSIKLLEARKVLYFPVIQEQQAVVITRILKVEDAETKEVIFDILSDEISDDDEEELAYYRNREKQKGDFDEIKVRKGGYLK